MVSMPKAAVDEDRDTVTRQYEIRRAGQIFSVEAESVAEAVQQGAHG